MDALLRCSIGNMRQEVNIDGSTIANQNGNVDTDDGGLLAQRTNSGTFGGKTLGVVPELGATLGYQLSQNWRVTVGYTFLYKGERCSPWRSNRS